MKSRRIRKGRAGFTFLEILVAMLILVLIVLMTSRLFQQMTEVWDTGTERADLNMTSRALLDFIVRDLSEAVWDPTNTVRLMDFAMGVGGGTFWTLNGTNWTGLGAAEKVEYSLTTTRDLVRTIDGSNVVIHGYADGLMVDALEMKADNATNPAYVDVKLLLRTTNDVVRHWTGTVYRARAYLHNRNRYRFDN